MIFGFFVVKVCVCVCVCVCVREQTRVKVIFEAILLWHLSGTHTHTHTHTQTHTHRLCRCFVGSNNSVDQVLDDWPGGGACFLLLGSVSPSPLFFGCFSDLTLQKVEV